MILVTGFEPFGGLTRNPSADTAIDLTTLRFGFVCDASRIPDPIASLIRRVNLLDVQVTTFDELAGGKGLSGAMDLVIALRNAGDAANDGWLYTDLLSRVKLDAKAPIDWENDEQIPATAELQLGKHLTQTFSLYVDGLAGIGGDKPFDWGIGTGLRFKY